MERVAVCGVITGLMLAVAVGLGFYASCSELCVVAVMPAVNLELWLVWQFPV